MKKENELNPVDPKALTPPQAGEIIESEDNMIPDEHLLALYEDRLNKIEAGQEEMSEVLADFLNMVMNDGDSTAASKEAVVNLIKAKSDANDKIIKILDLMTRIKLKERNTFPKYLAPAQHNTYNFGKNEEDQKKAMLAEIDKAARKKK